MYIAYLEKQIAELQSKVGIIEYDNYSFHAIFFRYQLEQLLDPRRWKYCEPSAWGDAQVRRTITEQHYLACIDGLGCKDELPGMI